MRGQRYRRFLKHRRSTDDEGCATRAGMLAPFSAWLVSVQEEIRADFGWSEADDLTSAVAMCEAAECHPMWSAENRLNTLTAVRDKLLSDQAPVVVLGAAVEVEDLDVLIDLEPHLVAADGSVGVLAEIDPTGDLVGSDDSDGAGGAHWARLALVVSDADGWPHLQSAVEREVPIALHAHGDNRAQVETTLMSWSEENPPPIFLTHQTTSDLEGIYNPGGFTDGDRAICLLLSMGVAPERLMLVGYDEHTFGSWSGVSDEPIKRRKLGWMAKILDHLGFGDGGR